MNSPFLMRCGNIRQTWISDVICGMKQPCRERRKALSAMKGAFIHEAIQSFFKKCRDARTDGAPPRTPPLYGNTLSHSPDSMPAGAGLHLCPILLLMIHLCAKHNPAMGMIMIPSKSAAIL